VTFWILVYWPDEEVLFMDTQHWILR